MLLTRSWSALHQLWTSPQTTLTSDSSMDIPTFAFSDTWSVLGPFQIGTREAIWGADPLEFLGGFTTLKYNNDTTFRSSLGVNGCVSWSNHTATLAKPSPQYAAAELEIDFADVNWKALRDVYGWAAFQYQAWVRGEIYIQSKHAEILSLSTPQILEFYIDGVHYFGGDFYGFERAPVTLRLAPGTHRIDVRLVRDVRAMGGVGDPTVPMNLVLRKSVASLQPVPTAHDDVLVSDFIGNAANYALASPYGSATVRNDAEVDINVISVTGPSKRCVFRLLNEVQLVPGQSRPIAFLVECIGGTGQDLRFDFHYTLEGDEETRTLSLAVRPPLRDVREPHKVTFKHPGGSISYAILRPPSEISDSTAPSNISFPVLLALHGAGLEADNDIMRHALDSLPDLAAWTLFPTGGTSWSGDDWHAWGFADVEAAVAMIPSWIKQNDWKGPVANTERWVVTGHSNGGQGTWYTLLHRPDNVFAAAPLSGYSSIQNYVPYQFWHPAEPVRTAMIQAALSTYRHELLLPNAKGIPVYQQHGDADDNVPPYHARQMSQLIQDAGADSVYHEYPGKPHWWDGVFTTEPLSQFLQEQVALALDTKSAPINLRDFSLVVVNPGDTGPKYGLEVVQIEVPGQYGRIDVLFDPITLGCIIRTSNIKAFRLSPYFRDCSFFTVDNQKLSAVFENDNGKPLLQQHGKDWQVASSTMIPSLPPRHGRQLGAMDAILRTGGTFQIVRHSFQTEHIALQISRNLCQYFAADTSITASYNSAFEATGNIISLAIGDSLPSASQPDYPIYIKNDQISIDHEDGTTTTYPDYAGLGLAAIFLRPLPLGRLELVVWGSDEKSLAVAARLVPMMTGSGQPDFVIADRSMLAKGLEGTLALGFLDQRWRIAGNAFFS